MIKQKWIGSVFLGLGTILFSALVFAQSGHIEQRQKLMKANNADGKALKTAVSEKDYATIELKAKDIAGNADKIDGLFPKGSTSDKSRALPAIWEKWDGFKQHASDLKKAATELADAAAKKDAKLVDAKFKAVTGACGSCHNDFRAERKK